MSPDLLLVIIVFLAVLGPELGAVPRNERSTDEPEIACHLYGRKKHLFDRLGIVLPEIAYGIVVGSQGPQ